MARSIDRSWHAVSATTRRQVCSAARAGRESGGRLSGLTVSEEGRTQASSRERRLRRQTAPSALPLRISLAILLFAYWCVDIVSPALPAIQESLALSATGAGLVFSVFFAGTTDHQSSRRVARRASRTQMDRGRRRLAALLLGSALAASATSQATLLPARGIQGVGVALLATAGLLSVLARSSRRRCGDDGLQPLHGRRRQCRASHRGLPDGRAWLAGGVLAVDGRFRCAPGWLDCWRGCGRRSCAPGARPARGRAREMRPITVRRGRGGGGESPGVHQLFDLGRLVAACWARRNLASMPVRWA